MDLTDSEAGKGDLKSLPEKLIPMLLAHNGSCSHFIFGTIHVMKLDPLMGLKCELLQRSSELSTPNFSLLEKLQHNSFTKVIIFIIIHVC